MNKMRYSFILPLITAVLTITGCDKLSNQPATNTANANAPIKTNANSNPSSTNTNISLTNANTSSSAPKVTMFTLPMLKAFLAHEAFIAGLKTRLQLTDNQISQLKTLVSEPKKLMSGNNSTDDSNSSYYARNYADEMSKLL